MSLFALLNTGLPVYKLVVQYFTYIYLTNILKTWTDFKLHCYLNTLTKKTEFRKEKINSGGWYLRTVFDSEVINCKSRCILWAEQNFVKWNLFQCQGLGPSAVYNYWYESIFDGDLTLIFIQSLLSIFGGGIRNSLCDWVAD